MGSILKMTARTIRSFFGRYLALLLIVALSVSFFAGLKVTKDAMYATAQDYLDTQNFCDFRLISTLGFSEDDVDSTAPDTPMRFPAPAHCRARRRPPVRAGRPGTAPGAAVLFWRRNG